MTMYRVTDVSADAPRPSTASPLAVGAQEYTDIIEGLNLVARLLRKRIAAGGPYHAVHDGLADDLVLVADNLLGLAAKMTTEAYVRAIDAMAVLPSGDGRRVMDYGHDQDDDVKP